MHDLEQAWARFRNGPGGDLLRQALALRSEYLASINLPRLPAEVILPTAVPWTLLALTEAQARGESIGRTLSVAGTVLSNSVTTWAAYREAKTLYVVEAPLAECLARIPWPEHVPTEALRLPSRCPVLTLPWEGSTVHVVAHYDLLTREEASGALELRLSLLDGDRWRTLSILHLTSEDLGTCVRAAVASIEESLADLTPEEAERQFRMSAAYLDPGATPSLDRFRESVRGEAPLAEQAPAAAADAFLNSLAGLALTLLLYLAGEPDIVRQVHPGAKPEREARVKRRDPERWKDLHTPTVYAVGSAFRAAVERWEIEQGAAAGEPTGRTVRPHMRRAHAHLYWTGPGRGVPRVRFLLPISVRGGVLVEEAERPVQMPVR